MPLWFYDLAIWSLQAAILVVVGGVMIEATRLRAPRARLIYLQILFAAALALPMLEPWRILPQAPWNVVTGGPSLGGTGMPPAQVVMVTTPQAHPFPWYPLAALVLLAGVFLRLVWLGAGLARLGRARREALPLNPDALAEGLRSAWGVSAEVLVSERLASPVTFGWRRPCVILPVGFTRMDPGAQRAILSHEFLHVRRRDWLWQVAEEIPRALFWFHPAIAWLVGQIRLAREQAVDQEVVAYTGSRREYLDALLEIASAKPRGVPAALFLSERHLKRRVALIVKEVCMTRKRMILALSASIATLTLAGGLAAAFLPLRISAAAQNAQDQKPQLTKKQQEQREQELTKELGNPYERWIRGPISYIITPDERKTFDELRSNEQREQFIEKFWVRRNPDPSCATNAFKKLFYERVAYANEHFKAAGVPGWRTDRGRIYIMWGPPDEVTPPSGSHHAANSVETWTYKRLPRVGRNVAVTFIDRTGDGNYQIAPAPNEKPLLIKIPGRPQKPGVPLPPPPPPPPPLEHPKRRGAAASKQEVKPGMPSRRIIVVTVAPDGSLTINEEPVSWDELGPEMRLVLEKRAPSDRVVYVRADQEAKALPLLRAVRILRQSGAQTIGLLTKRGSQTRAYVFPAQYATEQEVSRALAGKAQAGARSSGEPRIIFRNYFGKGPLVRVGGDAMAARIIRKVTPEYPEIAQEARIQGTVVFNAIVGADGTVQQLAYASGPPLLVEAAKEAVEQWRYKPETFNGKAVVVQTTISLVFTLGGA